MPAVHPSQHFHCFVSTRARLHLLQLGASGSSKKSAYYQLASLQVQPHQAENVPRLELAHVTRPMRQLVLELMPGLAHSASKPEQRSRYRR